MKQEPGDIITVEVDGKVQKLKFTKMSQFLHFWFPRQYPLEMNGAPFGIAVDNGKVFLNGTVIVRQDCS